MPESLFNKVAEAKSRPGRKRFLVNFVTLFRTPFHSTPPGECVCIWLLTGGIF